MKYAVLALLLAGCATQPPLQAPSEPVVTYDSNDQCTVLAKYARAMAIMRDIGVSIDNVEEILPYTPNVPSGALKRFTYSRSEKNPFDTFANFYGECRLSGYETVVRRLNIEESAYNFSEKANKK